MGRFAPLAVRRRRIIPS